MSSSRRDGSNAVAAFPLFNRGEPIGILLFCAAEKGAFTPGSVDLLQRIADNIAFALDNFDRADEKTRADERIEYLASHDSLTGLPNRDMFNRLLHAAMLTRARGANCNLRCCSSISTASRSSTIHWAMKPATRCWRK